MKITVYHIMLHYELHSTKYRFSQDGIFLAAFSNGWESDVVLQLAFNKLKIMSDIVLPTGQQIKDFVRDCSNGYFQQVEDYARIRGCSSISFQQVHGNVKLFCWFLWLH